MADPTQDPSMQDPSMSGSDPSQSPEQISVTITAVGDGTYTVSMSEGDESGESGEGSAQDDASDQPQTADNIDDAMKIAAQMFQAESMEDETDDGADGNAPMGADDAKGYWKQMAAKKSAGAGM